MSLPISKRYFVNDVICRVKESPESGTVVQIGTVEFPSHAQGNSLLEDHITNGFTEEFYVTWSHTGPAGSDGSLRKEMPRQLVRADDETIFLLDRQLSPGMFVRKINGRDDHGFGVVRAVDVFTSVAKLQDENQVISEIETGDFDRNWQSETILGSYVILHDWIGQIVEMKKTAVLSMEEDSNFSITWKDNLYDTEDEVLADDNKPMHRRFTTVGEKVKFSGLELLTQVKWIPSPTHEVSLFSRIFKSFENPDKCAMVKQIVVDQIRILWMEKLVSASENVGKVPKEWLQFIDYMELIRQRKLHFLMVTIPEAKAIGDTVFVKHYPLISGDEKTYDRWANVYLREMRLRSLTIEPRNLNLPPAAKKPRNESSPNADDRLFYLRAVEKFKTVDPGLGSIPGRVISRRSRVAVQWSSSHIESFPSTELVPVLLDKYIGFTPGTIVKSSTPPPYVSKDSAEYGVVIKNEVDTHENSKITVNFFYIPVETNVPVLATVKEVRCSDIVEHPVYNFRPGNILVRSNAYDEFSAGVFLGAVDTGELVAALGDGNVLKVWPNRVMKMQKKALYNFDTETWKVHRDLGQRLEFSQPLGFRHLMPSSWSLSSSLNERFSDRVIKVIQVDKTFSGHHFARKSFEEHPMNEDRIMKVLETEAAALKILPEGIWTKCCSQKRNLLFVSMEGPVGSIYEDCLFFFDVRLDISWPSWEIQPNFFFRSFFDDQLVPDFKPDGKVVFEKTLKEMNKEQQRYPGPENSGNPNLAAMFLEIREVSLKAEPIRTNRTIKENIVSIIRSITAKDAEKRNTYLEALIQVAKSIRIQILNRPTVWSQEITSYYMIHIPKFCARVIHWAMDHATPKELPNFPLLPMEEDRKEDLLEEVHKLMDVYNHTF